jgi:hypothetical protein
VDRRLAISTLLFTAANLLADEKSDDTTKVTGTVTLPKELDSFDGRILELRLYSYDPRIADKAADLVELVEKKEFKHAKGSETVAKFEIGANGKLEAGRQYYMTVFVLDGKTRTHIGELDGKQGLAKVLGGGKGREAKFVVRSVKK